MNHIEILKYLYDTSNTFNQTIQTGMKALAFTLIDASPLELFVASAGLNGENRTSLRKSLCLSVASLGFLDVESS